MTYAALMHLQSLKLLRSMVWEKCIFKKIYYLTFDLDLRVKLTRNVAQYPHHHHMAYTASKFEVATSNSLGGDAFTRKHTKCCNYPLNQVTYAATKFVTSNGLEGDAFTRHMKEGCMDNRRTLIRNKYTLFIKKKAGMITKKKTSLKTIILSYLFGLTYVSLRWFF